MPIIKKDISTSNKEEQDKTKTELAKNKEDELITKVEEKFVHAFTGDMITQAANKKLFAPKN